MKKFVSTVKNTIPETFSTKAVLILMFLFTVSISIVRASNINETDVLWAARNGEDLLGNGVTVFIPDVWNLLTLGQEWSPNSWLWNVFLYWSFAALGTVGFFWITFITNLATYLLFWLFIRRVGFSAVWQFSLMLTIWLGTTPFLNGRANSVDVLILAAFLYIALRISEMARTSTKIASYSVLSFLLSVFWVNLHLTAVIAVGVFPVIVYILHHHEAVKTRLLFATATGVATVVGLPLSPFGVESLLKVSLVNNESKDFFLEWSNIFASGSPNWSVIVVIIGALCVSFFAVKKNQYLYATTLLIAGYATYDTIRISPFLLTIALAGLSLLPSRDKVPGKGKLYNCLVVFLIMVVTGFGIFSAAKVAVNPENILPVAPSSFTAIPEGAHVATTVEGGGTLILYRPDTQVTLDGRNDLMGREKYVTATNIMHEADRDSLYDWLQEYDVDTVYIPDSEDPIYAPLTLHMQEMEWIQKPAGTATVFLQQKVADSE